MLFALIGLDFITMCLHLYNMHWAMQSEMHSEMLNANSAMFLAVQDSYITDIVGPLVGAN